MIELVFHPAVEWAREQNLPLVALESTLIAHGLPWPTNLETAQQAETIIHEEGATPATIGIIDGIPRIGLTEDELQLMARSEGVMKASRRDIAIALVQKRTAATTVAGTVALARQAGISLLATGGIGGVHRGSEQTGDISSDVMELAATPVAVVCSGAKSILDLPRTLELLETLRVPVIAYQTDEFPAFYHRSSGLKPSARADSPDELAHILETHWKMSRSGVVIAQPVPAEAALNCEEWDRALEQAEQHAAQSGVTGKDVTPFLLRRLADLTEGRSLRANQALILNNARLAARIAKVLSI